MATEDRTDREAVEAMMHRMLTNREYNAALALVEIRDAALRVSEEAVWLLAGMHQHSRDSVLWAAFERRAERAVKTLHDKLQTIKEAGKYIPKPKRRNPRGH